jgi:hypothetical protein
MMINKIKIIQNILLIVKLNKLLSLMLILIVYKINEI